MTGLRLRRHCSTAAVLLFVTCATCFFYALIHTCRLLCCATSESMSTWDTGFPKRHFALPSSIAVLGEHNTHGKLSWWAWEAQSNKDASLAAFAAQARAQARSAKEKELAAQLKVRAALERQAKRHKSLLKHLESQGWHLSVEERVSRGTLREGQQKMDAFLQSEGFRELSKQRRLRMQGKGIVMAAGGPVPLANAYVALHMLRRVHNCSLPVELFYNGPHELDWQTQAAFESEFQSLRCIDIARHELPQHQLYASGAHALSRQQSGWVLKAQMLSATSFAEVLVLDADNVPLADPSFLFESPEYRSSGNLFWPDFWSSNWHNPGPVYELLNLTEPWEGQPDLLTTESGQFLLDRRRYEDVIEWVTFLNLHADMVYAIIWGDKDTYRLAFSLAGKGHSFTQVGQRPANALRAPLAKMGASSLEAVSKDWAYTHAGMLQMSPSGQMLFLHRTAGSKLDPRVEYPTTFAPVDYITPPLTPRQAAQVHITGPMAASKFALAWAGSCAANEDMNLARAAHSCGMMGRIGEGPSTAHADGVFPIPLFGTQDFPGLRKLLQSTTEAFARVQKEFKTKRVPLGVP